MCITHWKNWQEFSWDYKDNSHGPLHSFLCLTTLQREMHAIDHLQALRALVVTAFKSHNAQVAAFGASVILHTAYGLVLRAYTHTTDDRNFSGKRMTLLLSMNQFELSRFNFEWTYIVTLNDPKDRCCNGLRRAGTPNTSSSLLDISACTDVLRAGLLFLRCLYSNAMARVASVSIGVSRWESQSL